MNGGTDEPRRMRSIVESILVVSGEPVSLEDLKQTLGRNWNISIQDIKNLLGELHRDYTQEGRGYQIKEIAGKFQLYTDPSNAEWVKHYLSLKNAHRLSKPALETLAIIAYRQPVTKLEIEGIRGVNVDGVLKKLTGMGLVRTKGRKEIPGHPYCYITTEKFLDYFGLKNLAELPKRDELSAIRQNDPERNQREESAEVAPKD